ncbi:hypothetical protein CARUB_v10007465mg [Capsella rubella]|uniref:F-box domain-containing protein n=1 Tax=Capsella rubella TaxID=81985 RepID=R0H5L2_9BRAS|nr:F-box/kelch-repeat protein KIB1 [Capsella rubella]EOA18843.1 hypothetical protein CARUB_v10007465mg [Capsella rubella]
METLSPRPRDSSRWRWSYVTWLSQFTHQNQKDDSNQPILIPDLVRSILERLSFVDFHRARCISSVWYTTSESSFIRVTNPTTPWLIFFPSQHVENNYNISCKLYDPHENKTYIVRGCLGFDLSRSRCLASSGSWFLMLESSTKFHLLNMFTRVRITLPALELTDGSDVENAVLWVDEERKDYLVVWNIASNFAYHKKGDNSWKRFEPLKNQGCIIDMVFKESKLYLLSSVTRDVTVLDFSGNDSPVECATFPFNRYDDYPYLIGKGHYKLAVTLSGEVLIIIVELDQRQYLRTAVYKIDPKSSEWRRIKSLEGETLLFDLGLTVAAKVMKNCIYFGNDQFDRNNGISLCDDYNYNRIRIYHVRTGFVFQVFEHLTAFSTILFKDARWFLPTFGLKWLL